MRLFWIISDRFDKKIDKSTVIEMVYEIKKMGYDLQVISGFKDNKYYNDEKNFYPVYFKGIEIPFLFRISLLLKIMFYLFKHCKKDDIIITHDTWIWIYAILRFFKKVKIHYDMRTVPVDVRTLKERINKFISWNLHMYLFHNVPDTYSFITESMKLSVEKKFKIKYKNYCYWSSGVSLDISKIHNDNNKKADPICLFYHGSITINRGIGTLIKAIYIVNKKIESIKLLLVGTGKDLGAIKSIADEMSISHIVEFLGFVPYEKISEYISLADICICPLPNRIEWNVSSPLKIFEYMACGKPIICTKIPAHCDVLGNLPFVIYSDEDEQSLADAIEYSIINLEKFKPYKNYEIQYANENYSWNKQACKLITFLESIYGKDGNNES